MQTKVPDTIFLGGEALRAVRAWQESDGACRCSDLETLMRHGRSDSRAALMLGELELATVLDVADVLPLLREAYGLASGGSPWFRELWDQLPIEVRRLVEGEGSQ